MRILALSDVHGDWEQFSPARMPAADAALCAGDLTESGIGGGEGALALAAAWLKAMGDAYPRVLWVPGNHDIGITAATFSSLPNVECILDRTVLLDRPEASGGVEIAVHGVSLCAAPGRPDLAAQFDYMTDDPDEEDAAYDFEPVDIVLSHCPPLGTLDLWPGDAHHPASHIGSRSLANYIRRHGPRWVLCGHVHGAAGYARLGQTQVWNVARRWEIIDFCEMQRGS